MTTLRIGFMPLTDAAGLIAAADFGFAEAQGIAIELHKEVSWANLRDKLMVGSFDAAHFLGAATIACALGIGQRRYPLRAAMLLNRNGNAITLASRVADELLAIDPNALDTWQAAAKALAQAAAARRASGRHQLTFGTVFPFSSHTYLLRRFFAAGGLDPDQDVEIIVTPPPFAVDLADRGLVDGFCVGSPWNSIAVESGKGVIAALGSEVLADVPEKVLAIPENSPLSDSPEGEALIRAILAGSSYAAAPENRERMAATLARADRIGCPAPLIARTLAGTLVLDRSKRTRSDTHFIRLDGDGLNRPSGADARWLLSEMIAAGQAPAATGERETEAEAVFSPRLYDRAVA